MGSLRDAPEPNGWHVRGIPGETRLTLHNSILSRVGASSKPGAIQWDITEYIVDLHKGTRLHSPMGDTTHLLNTSCTLR